MTPAKSGTRRRVRRPSQAAAVGHHLQEIQDIYPTQDWSAIAVGAAVEVIPPVGPSYGGRIDAKTPDSEIVWVVSDGTGRQMHGNREGVRLRPAGG